MIVASAYRHRRHREPEDHQTTGVLANFTDLALFACQYVRPPLAAFFLFQSCPLVQQ